RSTTLLKLSTSPPSSILFGVRSTMTAHHDRGVSRFSRRRLCLLSSSPSEERWKPTTIDDMRRLDGDSSVFCRLRSERNDGEGDDSLGLLMASPLSFLIFAERWKPTTIDDSLRLDGESSVFLRLYDSLRLDGESS
ncbi:LOW QUALITY PROTEIN: hypothetical protein HID58_078661, partial [Brassica napus]